MGFRCGAVAAVCHSVRSSSSSSCVTFERSQSRWRQCIFGACCSDRAAVVWCGFSLARGPPRFVVTKYSAMAKTPLMANSLQRQSSVSIHNALRTFRLIVNRVPSCAFLLSSGRRMQCILAGNPRMRAASPVSFGRACREYDLMQGLGP